MVLITKWFDGLWRDVDDENKNKILGLLEKKEGAHVLDVGCGSGDFSRRVADKVETDNICGLDIVEKSVANAREKNAINAFVADCENPFPFADSSFDIVVSNQVIEHLGNTDNFIKEIYRILRRGGLCILSTPNLASLHSIISLMAGYQPTCTGVSDEFICGNPFNPRHGTVFKSVTTRLHRRVFTGRALKELLTFHGFQVEKLTGWGLHPFPLFISKHINFPRYCLYTVVKARKPDS
jgi:ubiquinone/menaquinone biosynthesis C-methylase UbiE